MDNLYYILRFHFLSIFSFQNFDNAVVFVTITNDDIEYIENFIRTEMQEMLEHRFKQIGSKYDNHLDPLFYGEYAQNKKEFKFSETDRLMIEMLVKNVKKNINDFGLFHYKYDASFQLPSELNYFCSIENENDANVDCQEKNSKTHEILRKLLATADVNFSRKKEGNRFDHDITKFSAYIRMLSGPLAYDTIQKNLSLALPSLS